MSNLTNEQIDLQLQELPGWQRDGSAIVKTYKFHDFIEAISFMTQAAFYAEALEHHPEWRNIYNMVEVRLTTVDNGCITSRDIQLAKRMEQILQQKGF